MTFTVGYRVEGDGSSAIAANTAVSGSINEMKRDAKQFGDTTERSNAEASRSFQQLKASIDPVYRAELQLKQAQQQVNQAVRAGVITQTEAVRTLAQLAARNNALATSMNTVGKRAKFSGHQLQNVSYQVGDFAVQVGGGVAASQALAMQLPQLLGGFGVLGAVLGAVVAIGIPVARALFGTADAAESNIDPLERLAEAQDRARQSLSNYRNILVTSAADIKTEFGGMTQQVMDHIDALRILRKEQAYDEITDVLEQTFGSGVAHEFAEDVRFAEMRVAELQGRIDDLSGALGISVQQKDMLLPPMRAQLERIRDLPGIAEKYNIPPETIGSFLSLRDAINEAVAAGDFETANENVAALRDLLQEVPDGPLKDLIDGVLQAEDLLIKAGFAADGIAPGIDAAASSASILALNLSNALDFANQLSNAQSDLIRRETDADMQAQFGDDSVGLAVAQAGARFDRQNPIGRGQTAGYLSERDSLRDRELALARSEAERRLNSRNTGGGGGGAATQAESAAVQKLLDGLQQEIDLLQELDPVEQEMIRLRGQMADATAAETELVRELIIARNEEREALEANIERLDVIREMGHDVFNTLIQDMRAGATAGEILFNILDGIGQRLTQMAGDSLMDALFGAQGSSSGGAAGGFLSDLFGNIFKFADGGVVNAPTMFGYGNGQTGLMGEAGPEAIIPLTHSTGTGVGALIGDRETTLPLTRLKSGKLGVSIEPFAKGATFGGFAPLTRHSRPDPEAGYDRAARGDVGGGTVNHWHIQTPNPKNFAQGRATSMRAAARFTNDMGRHT